MENKAHQSVPFDLLAMIVSVCKKKTLPNENFLYYYAKNFIKKKNEPFSAEEAKLLVFSAPLDIGGFALAKVFQIQKDEKEWATYTHRFS